MADEQDPTPPPTTPTSPDAGPAPTPTPGLGDAFKRAFVQYLADQHIAPPDGGDVKVDLEFMKQHAGPLIVHMLRGATQSLMPRELKLSLKAPSAAPTAPHAAANDDATPAAPAGAEAPAADAAKPGAPINVSFDLGDFLARLLNPPRP